MINSSESTNILVQGKKKSTQDTAVIIIMEINSNRKTVIWSCVGVWINTANKHTDEWWDEVKLEAGMENVMPGFWKHIFEIHLHAHHFQIHKPFLQPLT